jgi:Transposase DNA-binding/Transposase DDE domain
MHKREFSDLDDIRLVHRGNTILESIFKKGVSSIRKFTDSEALAKGAYRFLKNDRVSEDDIVSNMVTNCKIASKNKYVVCIQDTTSINLSNHRNRISHNEFVGPINSHVDTGLGFKLHPCLVLDAFNATPYGYADIKVWNRPLNSETKYEREYQKLPIKYKESNKWLEVSQATKDNLSNSVKGLIIVQDREGDIYEQFATIASGNTDLLVRAKADRVMADGKRLFSCTQDQKASGVYKVQIDGKGGRKKREASVEIRFNKVRLIRPSSSSKHVKPFVDLHFIEAKEVGYKGTDNIFWRLLTTVPLDTFEDAKTCVDWYSWRWTIEEVFKILKKEGYQIENSELECASSIRKLTLMIMEIIIKLFLMQIAYNEPELDIDADTCFSEEEQVFMEEQIKKLEGKTEKQQNPFKIKKLSRYVWCIARLGGWKGYKKARAPGITTLWQGYTIFSHAMQGWEIARNVSTR